MNPLCPELTQMAAKLGITFPVQLPLFKSPPNRERLEAWAESQNTPMLRQIAHKCVRNIQYISFEDFIKQLQLTVADFNDRIKEEDYVLVIAEKRDWKIQGGCSDIWVAGLALEHCSLRPPAAILTTNQLPAWLQAHPNVKHILILDDAAYSGEQKVGALSDLIFDVTQERAKNLSVYMGIPFSTHQAMSKLVKWGNCFKSLVSLRHTHLPSVMDCLNTVEKDYIRNTDLAYFNDRHTLSYFDHRFPDFVSCVQGVFDGSNILFPSIYRLFNFAGYTCDPADAERHKTITFIEDVEQHNRMYKELVHPNHGVNYSDYNIPRIIPPYYLHLNEQREILRNAIHDNKIGVRSSYPGLDSQLEEILATTRHEDITADYKKPTLAIEVQSGFDKAVLDGTWKDSTWQEQKEAEEQQQALQKEAEEQQQALQKEAEKRQQALQKEAEQQQQALQKKIDQLYVDIESLRSYGHTLQKTDKNNGLLVEQHAQSLRQDAEQFFQNEKALTPANFIVFKTKFMNKLHQHDSIINTTTRQIIANIAIALTGIGALLLIGQLAYSAYTTGHASLFFQHEVEKQRHIDIIGPSLEQIVLWGK